MKKYYILTILTISVSIGVIGISRSSTNSCHSYSFNNGGGYLNTKAENITLIFKVNGMKSEQDALVIDEILKTMTFVISSSTDFKSGLCKVETNKIENKAKIIEAICYSGKKIGNKITAEFVDNNIENNSKN